MADIQSADSAKQSKDAKSLTKVKINFIGGYTSDTEIEGKPEDLVQQYVDALNGKQRAFHFNGDTRHTIFNLDNVTSIEVTK